MADPISLPVIPWSQVDFTPVSPVSANRMEGRRTEVQAFATPYWTAKFSTGTLLPKQSGLFDAFMMKADARGTTFLGYDVWRPRPIAMDTGAPLSGTKAGGGAFNGQVFFQSVSANTLYLGGLPAGFIFPQATTLRFGKPFSYGRFIALLSLPSRMQTDSRLCRSCTRSIPKTSHRRAQATSKSLPV